MAKREVEEEELVALQRAAALLDKLNKSGKARPHLERALKQEFPDIKTQDEQIEEFAAPHLAKVEEVTTKLQKKLDDIEAREQKQREDNADNALLASFQRLQSQGYTEEGLGKIASLMKERHIGDPEAAAALYDRMNPKAPEPAPSAWEPQHWNIESNAVTDTAALFKDEDKWADAEVGRVLADVRSQRAA